LSNRIFIVGIFIACLMIVSISEAVTVFFDKDIDYNFMVLGEPYGEMWNWTPNGVGFAFNIDDADVYYNLSNLTSGDLRGFTFTNADTSAGGSFLTAQVTGLYRMSFSMSFESEAQGGLYGFSISHNFDENAHRDCYSRREAALAVGSVSVTCLMDIEAQDTINIRIENENNNRDISVHTANLNVNKIAEMPI
jgi:hypothetical protein